MIVGIHGKIGSGKQALAIEMARHLRSFGYAPYYRIWAGKLKQVVQTLTGVEMVTDIDNDFEDGISDYTQEQKNIYIKEYDMTIGRMLQVIGTDLFRDHFSKRTWIDAMMREYYSTQHNGRMVAWIVPDTRFPNEADEIIDAAGGSVITVFRTNNDVRETSTRNLNHESETAMDNYTRFFRSVSNDGTLNDLSKRATEITWDIIKKPIKL